MKLKDLIERLERIVAEHGDIDVACTRCASTFAPSSSAQELMSSAADTRHRRVATETSTTTRKKL